MKKIKISQTSLNMNVNAFLLLSLSLFSCKSNKAQLPKEVESSLILAGENKKELERVIRHFSKHGKDSLKLRSAYFLISNMPYHTSTLVKNESTCLLPFIELADKKLYEIFKGCHVDSLATESFAREVEKIGEIIKIKMKNKTFEEKIHYQSTASDIEVFGSDFLINHIENAFKLRESPIVSLLSFDDFCEYILPYRLVQYKNISKNGKDYNDMFYKYLKTDTDDENDIKNTLERFKLIIHFFREILGDYPYNIKLGFEELFFKTPGYDCYDMVNTQGLILNACGIPVKAVFNLSFKNRGGSHAFLSLQNKYTSVGGFIPEDYVKGEKSKYFKGYADRTNFFRMYFSKQDNNPKMISNEYIPVELSSECIEDISSDWCPVDTIRLPFSIVTGNKLAYLATFNVDKGLICTTWGLINMEKNNVEFSNGLPNTLYFPVYMEGQEMKLFSNPFYYRDKNRPDDSFVYFKGEQEVLDSVHLTRKYPIKPVTIGRANNSIGTFIIASGSEEFREPDTLYTITQTPSIHYQDMDLANETAYKYYKIVPPAKTPYITITEIEYLTEKGHGYGNIATPTPLPVFKYDDLSAHREKNSLVKVVDTCINPKYAEYDGNELTARYAVKEIVLKLSTPQIINAIRFIPMNSRNGVYPKNQYTLFVWENNHWVVVGNAVAQYNYVLFNHLKTNTLYWLKNRTEGREELPFILDKEGKQNFLYIDIK